MSIKDTPFLGLMAETVGNSAWRAGYSTAPGSCTAPRLFDSFTRLTRDLLVPHPNISCQEPFFAQDLFLHDSEGNVI